MMHYNDILTGIGIWLVVENGISAGISTFIYGYK